MGLTKMGLADKERAPTHRNATAIIATNAPASTETGRRAEASVAFDYEKCILPSATARPIRQTYSHATVAPASAVISATS
jgi:hypothetical protein